MFNLNHALQSADKSKNLSLSTFAPCSCFCTNDPSLLLSHIRSLRNFRKDHPSYNYSELSTLSQHFQSSFDRKDK